MMQRIFIKQKTDALFGIFICIILGLHFSNTTNAQTVIEGEKSQEDSLSVVRVVVAGDAMVHSPQITWARNPQTKEYNYSDCFKYLKTILEQSDLNIVNLETTLAGAPYSGYPQFCAPDEFALALNDAGFNFFLLANNHSADKGTKGAQKTIEKLRDMNIPTAGTYLDTHDRQERYPAMMEINGVKIALLNYTYGTNGLKVAPPVSINNLNNTLQIKEDIQAAKDKQADIIIAFLHWGEEYQRQPNEKQKAQATFFFRQGVDVIVGSHPHVIQSVEYFAYDENDTTKKKLVYWSLGNFISNQRKEHTDGGILASFSIVKNEYTQSVTVENHQAVPYWVYRNTSIRPGYFVLPVKDFLHDTTTFNFSTEDKSAFEKFVRNTNNLLGD